MSAYAERIAVAAASVAALAPEPVEIGLILGSGLGRVAGRVNAEAEVAFGDIPGFPVSTAPGHAGVLVIGTLGRRRVACLRGRVHLYEGHGPRDVALPVYVMKALGALRLVVTNAAGALNSALAPGSAMLIADHLNFTGANPLTGESDDRLGLRFPDMSRAYDPDLRDRARAAAKAAGVALPEGVYAGIAGPSLETSAERRWLRSTGADAVGMSTVLEVIAARHAGLAVLGLSAITNAATGGPEQKPDTIEEVLENADRAGRLISALLDRLLPDL